MANKISVILEVAADKAVSGIKGFRKSIDEADGAFGKMKAGASSAFSSIAANAGTLALAAGTAIAAFGVKAVNTFTDTAISAGKFADASGLSTEAASRWVAVADDIGISGEAMEKSFGKLAVSIGKNNPLLEEYGITVKKGADGQADMNATMLNAIDVIKGIKDPTTKAAVAQAALGKGWMEMSELIEQGSSSLTKSMSQVSEAQVIDPDEVEKARKMRESMDNLQDAMRDLSLVVGEDLVPSVVVLVDGITKLIGPLMAVNQWSKNVTTSFLEFVGVAEKAPKVSDDAAKGIGRMASSLDSTTDSAARAQKVTDLLTAAIEEQRNITEVVPAIMDALKEAIENEKDAQKEAEKAAKEHTKALADQAKAADDLFESQMALVGGDIAVRDSQRDAAEAVAALNQLTKEGKVGTDEFAVAQDGAAQSLLDAAQAAADYSIDQAEANGETLSGESKTNLYKNKLEQLASTLAPGSPLRAQLQGYIDELNAIKPEYNTRLNLHITGATVTAGGDLIGIPGGARAAGGPVLTGRTYLVGEQGPEWLTMGANGFVTPLPAGSPTGGMSSGAAAAAAPSVTFVVEGNINGDKHLTAQLNKWARNVQREIAGAA